MIHLGDLSAVLSFGREQHNQLLFPVWIHQCRCDDDLQSYFRWWAIFLGKWWGVFWFWIIVLVLVLLLVGSWYCFWKDGIMYYFGVGFGFIKEDLDSEIKRFDGLYCIFKQVFVSYLHNAVIGRDRGCKRWVWYRTEGEVYIFSRREGFC